VSSATTVSSSVTGLVAALIPLSSLLVVGGPTWVEATLVVLLLADGLLVETTWVLLLLPLVTGLMRLRLLPTASPGATPPPLPWPGRV
jgi:hypothetical protein